MNSEAADGLNGAHPYVCQVLNSREVTLVIPTSVLINWLSDRQRQVTDGLRDLHPSILDRKEKNIGDFEAYVERMITGAAFGITPQIILYSERALQTQEIDFHGLPFERVLIPVDAGFVAVDGASQAAARAGAIAREPIAEKSKVSVRILHGVGIDEARQALHDLNVFGVRASASDFIRRDSVNPANQIAQRLCEESDVLKDRVVDSRSIGSSDRQHSVTLSAVRTGIAATFFGKGGFSKVNDIEAFNGINAEAYADEVITLWKAMLDHLKAEFVHPRRVNSVVPSPAFMGALGAMLNRCMPEPICTQGEYLGFDEVVKRLDGVSWDRSYDDGVGNRTSVWVGVGGKAQRGGSVSLGGPKEVGHRVTDALLYTGSSDGKQVRTQPILEEDLTLTIELPGRQLTLG